MTLKCNRIQVELQHYKNFSRRSLFGFLHSTVHKLRHFLKQSARAIILGTFKQGTSATRSMQLKAGHECGWQKPNIVLSPLCMVFPERRTAT